MAITPAQVADLLDPAVRSIVMGPYESWKPLAAEIFEVKKSDRRSEIMGQMSGHGYIPVKNAGQAYSEEEPVEGLKLTVTHTEYGLATQITESALEDDRFGLLKKVGTSILESAKHSTEKIAWDVVNNGFAAGTSYGDGLALYNTAKLRLGVGAPTFANKASTDVALSVAALKTALDTLRAQKNHNNLPHFVKPPYYLIVPPELAQTAYEIVNSQLKQGTANNDINYYAQQGLINIVVVPYMTSTTNWHVWAKNHGQKLFLRTKPDLRTIVAQSTGNLVYQLRFRASAASANQFGIFGSNI